MRSISYPLLKTILRVTRKVLECRYLNNDCSATKWTSGNGLRKPIMQHHFWTKVKRLICYSKGRKKNPCSRDQIYKAGFKMQIWCISNIVHMTRGSMFLAMVKILINHILWCLELCRISIPLFSCLWFKFHSHIHHFLKWTQKGRWTFIFNYR